MAKEMGLVNEVLPLARLLPRRGRFAEKIMQKPRAIRRMTSAVLRRQWKRRLVEDLGFHIAHELLGSTSTIGVKEERPQEGSTIMVYQQLSLDQVVTAATGFKGLKA